MYKNKVIVFPQFFGH